MKNTKKLIKEAEAPVASPTEATSKAAMMANVLDSMGKMSQIDLTYLFNAAQELIGKEADSIPDNTAKQNLRSINSNPIVSEELSEILESESLSLSNDTKEKATVLFESAVNTRIALLEAELKEQFEKKLEEEVTDITENIVISFVKNLIINKILKIKIGK